MKATTVIVICWLSAALLNGQARADLRPAEQVFKNIQVLKGIPVNQFMATMGFFSASLGANCTYCHVDESGGNWDRYADDNDHKRTARRMIAMASAIDRSYFMGRRVLTCYSCHRGSTKPETTPDLSQLYGPGRFPEPDQFVPPAPAATPADPLFDKYIQALGGAQRLSALTGFTAKGTYQGYAAPKQPMDLFAKAPGQRTMIAHGDAGEDTIWTYNGREGWIVSPSTDMPVRILDLSGGNLDGAKLDAALCFPLQLKQVLSQWRAGSPASIDDRDLQMVQATSDGRYPVNLYFDNESGLLVRVVRYADSPVGLAPTRIDYDDYREVAGIKMPFKWTVSWLDGRSTIVLTEVQPTVTIDASRFARPK